MVASSKSKSFIGRCSSISLYSLRKSLLKRVDIRRFGSEQQTPPGTYIVELNDANLALQSPLSPQSLESLTRDLYDLDPATDVSFTLPPCISKEGDPKQNINTELNLVEKSSHLPGPTWDSMDSDIPCLNILPAPRPNLRRIPKSPLNSKNPPCFRKECATDGLSPMKVSISVRMRMKQTGNSDKVSWCDARSSKGHMVSYGVNQSTSKCGREEVYEIRQNRPQPRPRPLDYSIVQ